MDEYNKLTQRLLSEGYTVENYPDYVQIDSSRWGREALQNLSGGFEYKRWYVDEFVYKTGCGKCVQARNVIQDLSYMGQLFSHENDNPVINCPYRKSDCELNDKVLHGKTGGGLCAICFCVCHRTDDPYDYEGSIEKANDERENEKERKYQEYSELHHGRVCRNHMCYNEHDNTWRQEYRPDICVNHCYSSFCPIRQRELSKKKGNVFYDLKTTTIRQEGTIFDGEEIVNITKGIRFFGHPVSIDICNDFIKIQSDEILYKYQVNYGHTQKMWNKSFQAEILNIRSESKETRDLLQDLEDIRNGIRIVHNSDLEKSKKEMKRLRKEERINRRILKVGKKVLLTGGFDNLDYSDKIFYEKYITDAHLNEISLKIKDCAKKKEKLVQMDISEFL